jgi:hypothetical protein
VDIGKQGVYFISEGGKKKEEGGTKYQLVTK